MPLYCGTPFVAKSVPKDLQPDDFVFYHKQTGEIFTNHDDYFERTILCSSLVWTCAFTGKSRLSFQEALESESQACLLEQTFQESHDPQQAPLLCQYLLRYISENDHSLSNIDNNIINSSNNPATLANAMTMNPGLRMDELARALVTSFDARRLLTPLLRSMFNKEVEVADCMQTLFRGNSLATRVMSYCFRIFGSSYLKDLLEPHIKPLVELHSTSSLSTNNELNDLSCEIDPSRLEPGADIERNRKNLQALTKQVFDSIVASSARFPPQLRLMCHCLYQVLHERYNPPATARNSLVAISTVIFLRFINPAIVSPCEAGIIEQQPDAKVKRKLMLVSKILQNIANNVEFRKEEHMLPFNDFVRDHFESVRQLVSEIAMVDGIKLGPLTPSVPTSTKAANSTSVSMMSNATVIALHRLLGAYANNAKCNRRHIKQPSVQSQLTSISTTQQSPPPPVPPPPALHHSNQNLDSKTDSRSAGFAQQQTSVETSTPKSRSHLLAGCELAPPKPPPPRLLPSKDTRHNSNKNKSNNISRNKNAHTTPQDATPSRRSPAVRRMNAVLCCNLS